MGNKHTRNPFKDIQDANLTDAEQQQIEEMLWVRDVPKFKDQFTEFKKKHATGLKLDTLFPVRSEFKPKDSDSVISEDKRLLNEVIQKMTYGFSSSEKKLNELQQGEFRNFEFKTIPPSKTAELFQQRKSCLLIALYLNRNKGGGAQSRQTLLEFFKEDVKAKDSQNAKLSMRIGSIFNPKHPLTKLQDTHIDSYYMVLKEQIREMLGAWHETDSLTFNDNIYEVDIQMLSVREILIKALEDDKSGKSDDEVRNLSLRLLTRIAILTKNPETLLMASYFQKKLQVDVTHEIKPFLGEAERFEKPEKEIQADDFVMQLTTLKDKVPLIESEDISCQMTLTYDAFAEDKNFFYNYSELRGMSRAIKGRSGNWKKVDLVNEDCKGLKGVSMVIHDDKLLVRHDGVKDQPFVLYDKNTLKPVQGSEETTFKFPDGDDQRLCKLDWSEEKLTKEDEDEEEKQTEEQKAEEERKRPSRRIGATPLASDGKFIYALSMQVRREEEKDPLNYEKLTVEVFEIADKNEVKRVKTFVLKKDDEAECTYKGTKYTTDGGYFNHAQTACNGRVFVLNLPHRTHFFKVESGVRFKSSDKRAERTHFQMVYEAESNTFSAFQTNVFQGSHQRLTIRGFEKRKNEEEIKKQQAPEVLKTGKEKISSEIDKCSTDVKAPEKLNIYEQIVEGTADMSSILDKSTENLKLRQQSKIKGVHDLVQAVILTTMAQKADQFDVDLDNLGQNTVIGEELLKYFRKDHCIYLTKTMFKYLSLLLDSLYSQQASGDVNIYMLASLSSLVRLVKINLRCLTVCKINLEELITAAEYESFMKMRNNLGENFGPTLQAAVQAKAIQEKAACEERANQKQEMAKVEEAKKGTENPVETEESKNDEISINSKLSEKIDPKSGELDEVVSGSPNKSLETIAEIKEAEKEEAKPEPEPEVNEDDDKEKLEEKWKNADRYTDLIIKQARELGEMLNNIVHATNPGSKMKELGENLLKSQAEDSVAIKACLDVFDALTNDKNMRDIIRGKKDDFEHFCNVVKLCMDLTVKKELRILKSETDLDDTNVKKFLKCAAYFTKCYVRQQCSVYADLLFELEETEVSPKKVPKEGEEPEEESDELKEKRKRNEAAKSQLEVIQGQIFHSFIYLTEKYSQLIDAITEHLRTKENEADLFMEEMEIISSIFEKEDCLLKNVKIMLWFFNFIKVETTWLDEVAEGIKNVTSSTNRFKNFCDGLSLDLLWKAEKPSGWQVVNNTMRQALYTMGIVAHQLISVKDEEKPKDVEKEKGEEKVELNKHVMLQGGLESRFIPELSDSTKQLIEGFFKITKDDQLRSLSLKKKEEVQRTEEDDILARIVEKSNDPDKVSLDGIDYIDLTLEVLQHAVCLRKGPLMRIGGSDGMRLSRAAFAVIIKFSEQIPLFRQLWDEIEMVGLSVDSNASAIARYNQIITSVKESKANEFEILCKQWEQASQIRKWTQELKKDLTESLKKDIMSAYLDEINEKAQKEKEEKEKAEAEEKSKKGQEEAKESPSDQLKPDLLPEDSSSAPVQAVLEETKQESAQAEESKDAKGEEEKKGEEKKDEEEAEKDSFTGPLTAEQEAEVETRTFKKMEEKLAEAIEDAIKKCKFVLKMMIPEAYQKQKAEDLHRELSRNQSQNIQLQTQGSGLVRAPSIKKRQSILVVEPALNRKDTQFDWKDRLKQWNQVQLSLGTITSFSQLGDSTYQSIPLSVISLIQSKFSYDKLKEQVEKVMIRGLCRSAGLNLISYGLALNIGLGTFLDLIQWFTISVRNNQHRVAHYSDNISGCGDSVLAAIRIQFFSIIKVLITKIKWSLNEKHLVHMLNALIWNYKGIDLNYLAKYEVINVLQFGDGSCIHPIRLAWGKQIKQKKQSDDATLTRTVVNIFEFLFKQILSQVILIDANNTKEEVKRDNPKHLEVDCEKVSFDTSKTLVSQVFDAIFSNLQRYIKITELFDTEPLRLFIQLNNLSETINQDEADKLADDKIFIEEQGGDEKVKKDQEFREVANILKFNMVFKKVLEQEKQGKQDYCLKLASLLSAKLPEIDAADLLAKFRARDEELQFIVSRYTFEDLHLVAPSEEIISKAVKEKQDDAKKESKFKQVYERLQELLKQLNQWLVTDKNATVYKYHVLYKKFASSFPQAWLYSLGIKDLERYWRDGQKFEKEEFVDDEKCKGISELQICLSTETKVEKENQDNEEEENEENNLERRKKRCQLCKKCFWFGVFMSILDAAPKFEPNSTFCKMLSDLPDNCEAIIQKPEDTIKSWLDALPEMQPPKEEFIFKDSWYILLQRVKIAKKEDAEDTQITFVARKTSEQDKNPEQLSVEKLLEMRKIKPVTTKKSKLSNKNMYHESFFFKILGLMDFYSSLALISPAALALVHQFADPRKLNILVQFLVGGLSRGKIIILRIFQDLMKLDFPSEIFDRAVEISAKAAGKDSGNAIDNEIKHYLHSSQALELSQVPFFKLIYSMLVQLQQAVWQDNLTANKGKHVLSLELARVFKSLPQNGEKNLFIQKLIQSKISEALLKIETCSGPEMEAIMSIINEASPNQIHVGSACANSKNQVFTVLGFSHTDYTNAKKKPSDIDLGLEFDHVNNKKFVYGLFYDPNSPERQEIIDCKASQAKFVRDLNDVLIMNAAKNSPFSDARVVGHLLKLLNQGIEGEKSLFEKILRNYIIRGFNNMILIQHNKYIQFLNEIGLSKDLLSFIVKGASTAVTLPKDAVKTTITQAEIKVDQMRLRALTTDISLMKSTPHKFYFGESRQSALIMIQEDTKFKYYRILTQKYIGFEEPALKAMKMCTLKAFAQINVEQPSNSSIVIISSQELHSLSKTTMKVVKASPYVITDDRFSLETFVAKIQPVVEADSEWATLAKTNFIVVGSDAHTSLLASVTSQDSGLTERNIEMKDLVDDELCRTLSKLSSAGVKVALTYIKNLIDFKLEAASDKTPFDLIETRILELIQENIKGEEFEKKKKEIQAEFSRITDKKSTKSEETKALVEEKKDNPPQEEAQKDSAIQAVEETKTETNSESTETTVMIDTTDRAVKLEKKQTEQPIPSNEMKTGVQKSLLMTDELNNHTTMVFERHDDDEEASEEEDIEMNFIQATEFPKRKIALHELYKEEMDNLENLQCRSTFFNMLAFGYKTYESVISDIEMTNDSFNQLQGLIFNELNENQYQSEKNNDKDLLKACQKKIKKMYKLFFNDTSFEQFTLRDLVERGIHTIEAIRANPEFDLDELRVSSMADQLKNKSVSDPLALCFLTDQLVKMNKLSMKKESGTLISLFEIFLSFSVLFGMDLKSKVPESMLQTCVDIMGMASENIEEIEDNDDDLNQLLNNNLFRWLCSGLNFETTLKVNKRKQKIMQIQSLMYIIQGKVLDRLSKKIEIAANVNRFITAQIKQRAVFEDGKSFKYLINSLQQKHVIYSEEDCFKESKNARVYCTDKKMFMIPFKFKIKSGNSLIKLHINKINTTSSLKLTTSNGGTMSFNQDSLNDGINNFILDQDSHVQVQLLSGTQLLHLGNQEYGCSYSESGFLQKAQEAELTVVRVACSISNTLFVGDDESLYAVGKPNTYNQKWEDGYSQKKTWVKLEKPFDCTNFLKVVASGSNRTILTRSGQLFCQGENINHYIDSNIGVDSAAVNFVNCTEVFPTDDDDQIIDVAQSYFFTVVITNSGSCFGVGHDKYRSYYDSEVQIRKPAYQIDLPGRATKCWASKMNSVVYVEIEDDGGNKKMFSGCEFVDMYESSVIQLLGQGKQANNRYGEQDIRAPFKQMKFPEGVTIKKIEGQGYRNAYAMDNDSNLWIWGQKLSINNDYGEEDDQDDELDLIPDFKDSFTPVKIEWFENNGLKVLDFSAAEIYAMVKVENAQGDQMFYGLLHPDYHYHAKREFGNSYKVIIPRILFKLENIDASKVVSFDCGSHMTMFVFRPIGKIASIIPGRETSSGLTHAFKAGDVWKFIPEDEYQARKGELPGLSYAIQYPFANFEQNALMLPDLTETLAKISMDEEAENYGPIKSKASGESFTKDEPLYCSAAKINGKDQRIYLKESEILQPDNSFQLNPLIYYRLSKPAKDISKLPIINLSKFYEQSGAEEEQIKFNVKKISLANQAAHSYLALISNEETVKNFGELTNFTNDDDRQLLKQIDKFITDELKEKSIREVVIEDFDFKKFDLKNERLKKMPVELLKMRTELFLKFTKQFINASSQIDFSGKVKKGSLSYYFLKNKNLALNSAKNKILTQEFEKIEIGGYDTVRFNRNKASVFAVDGKVDHDGTETMFGQCFQACKSYDPSYSMFRQQKLDAKCWSADFVGEAAIDAGGPFRDSLDDMTKELETEVLPLLIKSSNNRNDHGSNRDCFVINPSSRSPTHLEMFKFLGAFLSFAIMSQNPLPIHLAPSLWKQLLNDELDISDLEGFDAYSSQVLIDLRDHSSKLPEEEFTKAVKLTFTTILSNGEEVNLKPGEEVEKVTQANLTEYIDLVMKTRFNENKEQIEAMREGFKLVFTQELIPVLQLMDWEQIESRACGEKTVDIDKLKSITEYSGCNENSPIIKRFWKMMTSFDDDQRQLYLKFAWGRSRLPIDLKNLRRKHTISLSKYMDKTGFPQAHTCFFSIDLPDYPTEKIMRAKFLTAITMCGEIDTDGQAMTDFNGDEIRRGGRRGGIGQEE